MTVRVASGKADRWVGLRRVLVSSDERGPLATYDVESARGYAGKLVLKLGGVDDPNAAERLRGQTVFAPSDAVPALPEGVHYQARLVGLEVVEESGQRLGRVVDVMETGGVDLLIVEEVDGNELLVPFAPEIVRRVRETDGTITVRLPEGLRDLNRRERR